MACFPVRFQIAVMLFWHCFAVYMVRVNLSVNILAMRKDAITRPHDNGNGSRVAEVSPNKYYSHYNWSPSEESNLLGAYYYGYVSTSLFGGIVCETYGPRMVGGICLILNVVFTFFTPFSTGIHFWTLFVCRLINGMLAGLSIPGNQTLIAKWAPPTERAIFVATIIGSSIGTMLTWLMSSYMSEYAGWDWSFYASGFICLAITIAWFIIVADSPDKHWYINSEERDHILGSLRGFIMRPKGIPPYKSALLSVPFLSVIVLHYGHMWNLYFQLTLAPRFFRKALDFSLTMAGTFAGIPYIIRSITVFGFAAAVDTIKRHDFLPTTLTRKVFCTFSHIMPSFLLLLVAAFVDFPPVCVPLLCICMGFNAAAVATNLINVQDLAPNYAGTLYGIMNFFANTSGFITPLLVAKIVGSEDNLSQWKIVFVINAFMYLVPGVIFILFGSGELQPWNSPKPKSTESLG